MSDRGTALDYASKARLQNSIAVAIRVAIGRASNTLDLPKTTAGTQVICEALRNVLQEYQIRLDLDVSPELGESATFPMKDGE